jgi:hypothetical protein
MRFPRHSHVRWANPTAWEARVLAKLIETHDERRKTISPKIANPFQKLP